MRARNPPVSGKTSVCCLMAEYKELTKMQVNLVESDGQIYCIINAIDLSYVHQVPGTSQYLHKLSSGSIGLIGESGKLGR